MNAYELADYVDAREINNQFLKDAANMLRQQADQIKEKDVCLKLLADRIAELERLAESTRKAFTNVSSELAELEKQNQTLKVGMGLLKGISKMDEDYKKRQSEPVAWMDKNDRTRIQLTQEWSDDIPLYTTPQTKPLSDEEIIDICALCDIDWSEEKGLYVRHSNGSWIGLNERIGKLVRAIEAKVKREQ